MTTSLHATRDLTKNQSLVYSALYNADGPLSAYSILDLLRKNGLRAPQQVYRALDKLLERGLIHRLESINAFVACTHHDHTRQSVIGFAICEICERVIEFSDPKLTHRLTDWAEGEGFGIKKTTIEIRGLCEACAAGSPPIQHAGHK